MERAAPLDRYCELVAPVVRTEARACGRRLGLRAHDREDLEQDIWLLLVLWWREGSVVRREEVASRVRRVAAIVCRTHAARRRREPRLVSYAEWMHVAQRRDAATPCGSAFESPTERSRP